ncbi:hypothetical protein JX265_005311 [Neoarthrinium moseri]|uniref:DUF1772-domain-containing protein n=1 Tax=Neoarthrinium moseri TaxID=1658444 RepID=A0A9Q0AMN6_9PEZI|nr:uncharacterized protein JN550_006232 [Neoarthrinium moseri]KAI1845621.1 hypothetical protein JX266_008232 [Neoarthrinium moseri]KAI1868657.1 hypothetical protein JN550_006232 [Neoarthrinium moseri]KAI1872431.1 hypothetical protein JX265_005311 [Neoarthrinium moseri]
MAELPGHIRATQAASIALLTTTSGLNLGLSFFVIPRLLELPTPLMLRQWGSMFRATSRALPPGFVLPAALNAYLAYRLPGKARVYGLAAALALSVLPYTYGLLMPINRKLLDKARDVEALGGAGGLALGDVLGEEMGAREETGHALIDTWGVYNLYRGGAAFVAGCVGLYAALW